jgi:hypothetical protein
MDTTNIDILECNYPPKDNRKYFLECFPIITGSSLENGSMVSPHWLRSLRLQPASAVYQVGQTGAGGYADSDKGIHPRHPSSHQLWASEIPSVKSPVMSCNMAQAAQLSEKKNPSLPWFVFFPRTRLLELVS